MVHLHLDFIVFVGLFVLVFLGFVEVAPSFPDQLGYVFGFLANVVSAEVLVSLLVKSQVRGNFLLLFGF